MYTYISYTSDLQGDDNENDAHLEPGCEGMNGSELESYAAA